MVFKTFAYTNKGGRSNNEDSYNCTEKIWIVADGLGGHDYGEVASAYAAKETANLWKNTGEPMNDAGLINVMERVNSSVIEMQKQSEEAASMRTTLVFAVTDGKTLRFANVGDSRFYYFRNNKIIACSEDHSVSAAVAKLGEIRYEDIRFNEDRNKLLKVIGNEEDLKIKELYAPVSVQPGDAFLLCSDGFWEYVYEQEMEIDLSKSEGPKQWLSYMAKRLILRTETKDNDNFTAICVMIN